MNSIYKTIIETGASDPHWDDFLSVLEKNLDQLWPLKASSNQLLELVYDKQ